MRCFMPSKQTIAYIWPIAHAMPFLFGNATTRCMHCLATDAEGAMVDAIKLSINNNTGYSDNMTHCIDCYHLFVQKWYDEITLGTEMDHEIYQQLIDIKGYIRSWFASIESVHEFNESQKEFTKLMKIVKTEQKMKKKHIVAIESIVTAFDKRVDACGYWNFRHSVTFGFLGSTISEAENSTLQSNTLHPIHRSHTLEKAAHQLTNQTKAKTTKSNRLMAKNMNRKQQWSKSKTSNILTPYMEGLCVKLFDHRQQVQSIYIGNKEWLVMRKSFLETSRYKGNRNDDDKEGLVDVFDSNNEFSSKHLKFEHCRLVT